MSQLVSVLAVLPGLVIGWEARRLYVDQRDDKRRRAASKARHPSQWGRVTHHVGRPVAEVFDLQAEADRNISRSYAQRRLAEQIDAELLGRWTSADYQRAKDRPCDTDANHSGPHLYDLNRELHKCPGKPKPRLDAER